MDASIELSGEQLKVFELLDTPVMLIENNYDIIFYNKKGAELFKANNSQKCYKVIFNRQSPCNNCPLNHQANTIIENYHVPLRINTRHFRTTCKPVNKKHTLIVLNDITSEQHLIKTLKQSKKNYKNIVNYGNNAIVRFNNKGDILFANKFFEKTFQLTFEQLAGNNIQELPLELFTQDFKTLLQNNNDYFETSYHLQSGELHMAWSIKVVYNIKKQPTEIIAIGTDISETKKRDLQLHEKDKYLQSIYKATPMGIGVVKNRVIVYANKRFYEITGYSEKEIIGNDSKHLYHSIEEYDRVGEELYSAIEMVGIATIETQIKTKDGLIIDVLLNASVIDNDDPSKGSVFALADITESKEIERTIRLNQEKIRTVLDAANDAIILTDAETGIIIDVNEQAENLLGYPCIELIGKHYTEIHPPELKEKAINSFNATLERPDKLTKLKELAVIDKHGKWQPVEINASNYRDENGHYYNVAILRDIRERKNSLQVLQAQKQEVEDKIKQLEKLQSELTKARIDQDQVHSRLTETEHRYQQLFTTMTSGFSLHKMVYDEQGKPIDYIFLETNPAFEQLTGLKADEIINRAVSEVIPNSEPEWIEQYGKVARFGETIHYQNYSKQLNKHYEVTAYSPKKDYFAVIFNDITERLRIENDLRKSEESFKRLTENSPDTIIRFNTKTQFVYASEHISQFTGVKASEYIGKTIREVGFDKEQLIFWAKNIDKVFTTKKPVQDIFETYQNDNYHCFDWRLVPEFNVDDQIESILGIGRDISEEKLSRDELIIAKQLAEESDKLKSSFLANMSHEIRTPLNAIVGFSSLLDANHLDNERKKKYIGIIKDRSEDLLNIIDDILDISTIETGMVELEKDKFELEPLFHGFYKAFQNKLAAIDKQAIRLILNIPPECANIELETDQHRFKKVINNLLDNAVKFTEEGSIEFGYQKNKQQVEFYVKDTGIGIPDDKYEVIFERFRQLEYSMTRNYGGNGLGLAICKSFVEFMEGNIWVQSEVKKGSTFKFVIPYHEPGLQQTNKNTKATRKKSQWPGVKILLVEDDVMSAEFICELLDNTKLEIIVANNGRDALQKFNAHNNLKLILMDIQLPDISGMEVTKMIRAQNKKIPIIAQTAFAMAQDRHKFLKGGCTDYLSKPINIDNLFDKLNQYLPKP